MKRNVFLVMAMFAIIGTAACLWACSFQLGRILHVDHRVIDVLSSVVLAFGFAPSGMLTQKKEDEV